MDLFYGWRISRIIPAIIVAVFALDVLARFAPLDWFTFRAWEAMSRYHAPCGPFRSNASFDGQKTYGDLAAMGNFTNYRQYRREVFTTDPYGYRQNGSARRSNVINRVIVLGDSMAVGLGVSDHQTLAARLEQLSGFGVYNAASPGEESPTLGQVLELATRLEIKQGTVFYQTLGRWGLPTRAEFFQDTSVTCSQWPNRLAIWYNGFVETSPLQILSQQIVKRFQNDVTFPNIFKSTIIIKTLAHGDSLLFYPRDVKNFRRPRAADISGLSALAEELTKHRLRLVVILVPDKYTVYEPLLKDAQQKNSGMPMYLDQVEASLKAANVPAVNLTQIMRQTAKEEYQQNHYLYWHDDAHWNARGIELAAEAIIEQNLIH